MKSEHKIVLCALEIANAALGRVVSTEEVIKALTEAEANKLKAAYAKTINQAVPVILSLLTARKLVFSPGLIGTRRYYGSVNTLNAANSLLPNFQSRRQRVLMLLRDAVQEFGRAVRIGDVVDYAKKRGMIDLAPQMITRYILSLLESHNINSVGIVRADVKGNVRRA
ncbi:MAG: hypothetical protein LC802_04805 [Acidobacteria bacterium]|nr:hypothetical protein [Acidobacteriota bacterium]